eukprot:4042939-Prymnesium_polylepis.1
MRRTHVEWSAKAYLDEERVRILLRELSVEGRDLLARATPDRACVPRQKNRKFWWLAWPRERC